MVAELSVNPKKVTQYRTLRFESLDDLQAEVRRIREAAERGELQTHGNWTAGQILAHLAAWIDYGWDGFPIGKPMWLVRWILSKQLAKMLDKGMPRGVRIPGVQGGTTGAVEMPLAEAADRYERALHRLQAGEVAKYDSPAFGPMSEADRIRLHLRHAELHLGYLEY